MANTKKIIQPWNDGRYVVTVYRQSGGSPAPASDTAVGGGEMVIKDDMETYQDVLASTRLATSGYTAPDNNTIAFIQKWILNKLFISDADVKLYDDDNTTVLKTWLWDDVTKTRGKAT